MSSSDRKSWTLAVNAPRDARVSVLDGEDNVVASGIGSLSATLPQGLYSVRAETAGRIAEELVRLNGARDVHLEPPRFSSAPIAEASNSHEYYGYPAEHWSKTPTRAPVGGGSRLFVFVRMPKREMYSGEPLAAHLQLRDGQGNVVSMFTPAETITDMSAGFLAFCMDLAPGPYRLAYDAPENARELSLEIPLGWDLQVFLTFRRRPLLESATLLMARYGAGFRRDDEIANTVDLALKSLQDNVATFPSEQMAALLQDKFDNPMLGLLGAHLLMRRREVPLGLMHQILANLFGLIGPEPDVLALQMLLDEREKLLAPVQISRPPMLRAAFDGIIRISATRPDVVVEGSLFESVALRVFADSPWVTWEPKPSHEMESVVLEGYFGATPAEPEFTWLHTAILDALHRRKSPIDREKLAERLRVSPRVLERAVSELKSRTATDAGLESLKSFYGDVPEALDFL